MGRTSDPPFQVDRKQKSPRGEWAEGVSPYTQKSDPQREGAVSKGTKVSTREWNQVGKTG